MRRIFEVLVIGIIASLIAGLILAPYLIPVFWKTYRTELYIALLLITILSLIYFIRERITTIKKGLAEAFDVSRPVKKLTPADFHVTNYREFYIERESDKEIENLMNERKYVFITGIPMIGKTRMAYEATKKLKGFYLLKPKYERIDIQKLKLPLFRKKIVLFLDDLDKYVGKFDLDDLVRKLREKSKDFVVIATCRSGKEFDQVKAEKEMETLLTRCQKRKTEPRKLEPEEQKKLATAVDKRLERIASDGTPGSIAMDLRYMKERYEKLEDEKSILKTLKLLRGGNIFLWKENLVKEVSKSIFDLSTERTRWDGYLKSLLGNGFINQFSEQIFVSHDVYLDDRFLDDYFVGDGDLKGLEEILFHKLRDAENLNYLAKAYILRYDTYYDRSLSVLDEAERISKKALSIDPELPEAHRSLGRVYKATRNNQESISEFKKAIELKPDYFEAYRALGWIYEEMRNYDEAIACTEKALEIRPSDLESYLLLGIVHLDKKEYQQAEKMFSKALEVAPDCGTAYYYVGNTYQKQGKFDRALEIYEKCIKVDGDPNVYLDMGWIYILKGQFKKAIASFKSCIELGHFEFLANYWLGLIFDIQGKKKEAEDYYKLCIELSSQLLEHDPENPYFHSILGLAYTASGKHQKGVQRGEYAVSLDPENGAVLYDLARIYALQNNSDKAIQALEKALDRCFSPSTIEAKLDPHFKSLHHLSDFTRVVGK